jgi:hypothetical protein
VPFRSDVCFIIIRIANNRLLPQTYIYHKSREADEQKEVVAEQVELENVFRIKFTLPFNVESADAPELVKNIQIFHSDVHIFVPLHVSDSTMNFDFLEKGLKIFPTPAGGKETVFICKRIPDLIPRDEIVKQFTITVSGCIVDIAIVSVPHRVAAVIVTQ